MQISVTPVMWSWIVTGVTSRSIRNHSNMLICCSRNIYYYVENSGAASCFCGKFEALMYKKSFKEQHLFEIQIFCNIIKVSTLVWLAPGVEATLERVWNVSRLMWS